MGYILALEDKILNDKDKRVQVKTTYYHGGFSKYMVNILVLGDKLLNERRV